MPTKNTHKHAGPPLCRAAQKCWVARQLAAPMSCGLLYGGLVVTEAGVPAHGNFEAAGIDACVSQ